MSLDKEIYDNKTLLCLPLGNQEGGLVVFQKGSEYFMAIMGFDMDSCDIKPISKKLFKLLQKELL